MNETICIHYYTYFLHKMERMRIELITGCLQGILAPLEHVSPTTKRSTGFEPTPKPWQGFVLPLHHERIYQN